MSLLFALLCLDLYKICLFHSFLPVILITDLTSVFGISVIIICDTAVGIIKTVISAWSLGGELFCSR